MYWLLIGLFFVPTVSVASFQFTYQLLKNPLQVGAWFQSSASVAQELTRAVEMLPGPRRILELGAGMGAVTREVVSLLREEDHLDVVEINPVYADHLRHEFASHQQVGIYCTDAIRFEPQGLYDVIICTLPLTSFSCQELGVLFQKLTRQVRPGGYISFIEYMLVNRIRKFFQSERYVLDIEHKKHVIERFKNKYLLVSKRVLGNLPPVYVHHLCITSECYNCLLSEGSEHSLQNLTLITS